MAKWSDVEFVESVKRNISIRGVLSDFGLSTGPGNYKTFHNSVKTLGLDTSHFKGRSHGTSITPRKRSLEELLRQDSLIASSSLRKILLKNNLLKNECVKCGNNGVWQGSPITLQLDHINGDPFDNRLENLRILCPNCHTQTNTFGSKRNKNGLHRSRYLPSKAVYRCVECESIVSTRSERCNKCNGKHKRTVNWPEPELLVEELKTKPYTTVASKLGTTDNAIRKYLKSELGSYPKKR